MANTIRLKQSSTASAVPTTGQLALGEVAINTYDGKMYIKKDDGTEAIVQVGTTITGGMADLVDDTTPQLGGDLDTLDQNLTNSNDIWLNTDRRIKIDVGGTADTQSSIQMVSPSATGQCKVLFYNSADAFKTKLEYSESTDLLKLQHNGSGGFQIVSSAGVSINGLNYPTSDGTADQVLTTNGSGALSFQTIGAFQGDYNVATNTPAIETSSTTLTGTVSLTTSSTTMTGSGTAFTTELQPGDTVQVGDFIGSGGTRFYATVDSITSDTELETLLESPLTASGETAKVWNTASETFISGAMWYCPFGGGQFYDTEIQNGDVIVAKIANAFKPDDFFVLSPWSEKVRPYNAPTSSTGAAGDVLGMIAFDSSYFYVCTANYDGSTSIWKRTALSTW